MVEEVRFINCSDACGVAVHEGELGELGERGVLVEIAGIAKVRPVTPAFVPCLRLRRERENVSLQPFDHPPLRGVRSDRPSAGSALFHSTEQATYFYWD